MSQSISREQSPCQVAQYLQHLLDFDTQPCCGRPRLVVIASTLGVNGVMLSDNEA